MQEPKPTSPEVTTPEVPSRSADEVLASEPKKATSDLDAPLQTETTSPSPATVPLDQDQVPDKQAETQEDITTNPVAVTDHSPPAVDSEETRPRREPAASTNASTPNYLVDELVTGVCSLHVNDATTTGALRCKIVLTSELDPSIPVVNRAMSPRRSNAWSSIPAPYSVIVTRDGFALAYTNIHKPEAYIEQVLMNETEY
ncbi:hypothetical protein HDU81_004398 [Chytriomyces hyalinus]|nr:hypothetical protein HDU81_004398 [Chytriomyces hyalinus]